MIRILSLVAALALAAPAFAQTPLSLLPPAVTVTQTDLVSCSQPGSGTSTGFVSKKCTTGSLLAAMTAQNVKSALTYTPLNAAAVGAPAGVAPLDGSGMLPSAIIPTAQVVTSQSVQSGLGFAPAKGSDLTSETSRAQAAEAARLLTTGGVLTGLTTHSKVTTATTAATATAIASNATAANNAGLDASVYRLDSPSLAAPPGVYMASGDKQWLTNCMTQNGCFTTGAGYTDNNEKRQLYIRTVKDTNGWNIWPFTVDTLANGGDNRGSMLAVNVSSRTNGSNGPATWAANFNNEFDGTLGGLQRGVEIDMTNNAANCDTSYDCYGLWVQAAGNGHNSAGIQIDSQVPVFYPNSTYIGWNYGIKLGNGYGTGRNAQTADIEDESSAIYGVRFTGASHSGSTIRDETTSPRGFVAAGSYSGGAFDCQDTSSTNCLTLKEGQAVNFAGYNSTFKHSGGALHYYFNGVEILNVGDQGGVTYRYPQFNMGYAAGHFDGTASSPTVYAGLNISSVTKNGTGDYTLNFPYGHTAGNINAIIQDSSQGSDFLKYEGVSETSTTFRFRTRSTGGALKDYAGVTIFLTAGS